MSNSSITMTSLRKKRADQLASLSAAAVKHRTDAAEAVELYGNKSIANYRTAQRIIEQLQSKRKATVEKGLAALDKHRTEKDFFVTGHAKILSTYSKIRTGKRVHYDKQYESTVKASRRIRATTAEKARIKFQDEMVADHPGGNGFDTDQWRHDTVEDVFIDDVTEEAAYAPRSEMDTPMRSARPVKYDFISSDESFL